MLPLDVVRAVESVRTFKPFLEDVQRFRLIPDPEDPDGLPVGMSAQLREGKRAEPKMVFFNCAACHTAELTYRGKVVRVDGGPARRAVARQGGGLLAPAPGRARLDRGRQVRRVAPDRPPRRAEQDRRRQRGLGDSMRLWRRATFCLATSTRSM